ncbi:hypothetical protein HYH03_009408 [Edaphochlamys debaryana]|uniref:Pherophorin domain-containing protein n=1 Tax=Edaphochlamys debaryana TaxID=47281 RepID=A0A835XWL9_9CHLO|nr:hypothetical protein HYH03_009408 [Edaphochlamys debaryana]|eukprot:KAG2492467.1 hypothetical protein HYH03_009408 [Edaphochlamys debaryana]
MRSRALLALCGLLLAAGSINAQFTFGSGSGSGLQFVPRFTRLLKQDLSSVASYLLPTKQNDLCANINGKCCQADSYASPYGLTYLNHTQQAFGGRTYTTFFYAFHSRSVCNSNLDEAACCSASADNIWVDVDPTLKVKYVAFGGRRLSNTEQSDLGLKLGTVNVQVAQAKDDIPVAITVEGAADALCPPPGLAPVPGLCEVVVQGATPANPNACCPASISRNDLVSDFVLPAGSFQCSATITNSPFKLVFDSVSAPQTANNQQFVSYSFRLVATSSCSPDGVADCCAAQLSYLELKVTDLLPITNVMLNGNSVGFTTSSWNEPNSASYRSLVVDNLNLVAEDMGAEGLPLTVTVRLPSSSAGGQLDLCDASSDPSQGGCAYYLHSEDGICCASDLALPANVVPAPPPGVCAPSVNVPLADTTMGFSYYEWSSSSAQTTFTFLLANDRPDAGCAKPHCVDVCSWTLYINPDVASGVAVGHEDPRNNGRQILSAPSATSPAQLTFTYGPAGQSSLNFFVSLPAAGMGLADLCARNALPGQGSKACAALVRSKDVYVMVFFDESDVIIRGPSPPAAAPICPSARPMADACLAVTSARYNTLLTSAVFDFAVTPAAAGAACVPPSPPGRTASVHLVLTPATVDQLTTRNAVRPAGSALALNRNDGARWAVSSTAAASLSFQVQGPLGLGDVCRQGVTPDQPANTCVAEVLGDNGCFRGFVGATADGSLIWIDAPTPRNGVPNEVVVPAVVVPVVALLAALLLVAAWWRRRRQQRTKEHQYARTSVGSVSDSDDLQRPLAGSGGSGRDLSVASASVSASDVQVRVSGPSQGGAR